MFHFLPISDPYCIFLTMFYKVIRKWWDTKPLIGRDTPETCDFLFTLEITCFFWSTQAPAAARQQTLWLLWPFLCPELPARCLTHVPAHPREETVHKLQTVQQSRGVYVSFCLSLAQMKAAVYVDSKRTDFPVQLLEKFLKSAYYPNGNQ